MTTKFLVRIEMHGSDDYDLLHMLMERAGHTRYVTLRSGQYHLPGGTYLIDSGLSLTGVQAAAERVTARVCRSAGVVTCVADEMQAHGLRPVTEEATAAS